MSIQNFISSHFFNLGEFIIISIRNVEVLGGQKNTSSKPFHPVQGHEVIEATPADSGWGQDTRCLGHQAIHACRKHANSTVIVLERDGEKGDTT